MAASDGRRVPMHYVRRAVRAWDPACKGRDSARAHMKVRACEARVASLPFRDRGFDTKPRKSGEKTEICEDPRTAGRGGRDNSSAWELNTLILLTILWSQETSDRTLPTLPSGYISSAHASCTSRQPVTSLPTQRRISPPRARNFMIHTVFPGPPVVPDLPVIVLALNAHRESPGGAL